MEFCVSMAAIGQTTITSFFSVDSSTWSGDDGVGEVCVRRDLTLLLHGRKTKTKRNNYYSYRKQTVEIAGDSLIVFGLMGVQVVLVLGHVRAPAAHAFAMHLEHVGGQPLGPGRFVLAKHALVRFHVGVQVPFQAPVVHARPRTKRAAVPLLEVLSGALGLGLRRGHHCRRGRRRARRWHD